MSVVVSRSLIGGFLGLAHRLQLLFTGVAAIGEAFVEQGLNRCLVLIHPLALDDGVLIPVDPEPLRPSRMLRVNSVWTASSVSSMRRRKIRPLPGTEPIENGSSCRADAALPLGYADEREPCGVG